jgi:hypothetical protein
MNSTRFLNLARGVVARRSMATVPGTSNGTPASRVAKEQQKMFQIDNGLRVHERGGTVDKLLYYITTGVMIVGGVMWCQTVYQLAFPPKKE